MTRTITPEGMTLEPEKTEEEQRLESSSISFQRELTPEEESRVLFLKNLLAQLLIMAEGQPTEEQRAHIRDIEKELEKITGVKVRSSLSSMTKNMPGKKDKDDDEKEKDIHGIDPKEAAHSRRAESDGSANPGMQMLQRNMALLKLCSLFDEVGGLKPSS
ncbi:hypothetical protein [Pseudodesulfovibrio sp. S3]|uniref:hypothetical protein n=1 Tax=Pseudodesulfovibrio sp. S3 TaxID=2283629 RepID=UPI0019D44547|nr:hypothetical protein [Pseudodesulfovibrio sp. S3]MCJ2163646.1 hypothetical protein [Pseudodesulfovibrio sp. S3-i]